MILPFDYELASEGLFVGLCKIVTRQGDEISDLGLCMDPKLTPFPVYGKMKNRNLCWTLDGSYYQDLESPMDLFIEVLEDL
jgi:hypothetical protein